MFYRKRSNFQRLKARKRELDNCIEVDDDGYVIPVDLLKDLEARGRKAPYGSQEEKQAVVVSVHERRISTVA
jgi:hypothetical protein